MTFLSLSSVCRDELLGPVCGLHIFVIVVTVYRCVIRTCMWSEVLNDIFVIVITVYRCVIRTCMWSGTE